MQIPDDDDSNDIDDAAQARHLKNTETRAKEAEKRAEDFERRAKETAEKMKETARKLKETEKRVEEIEKMAKETAEKLKITQKTLGNLRNQTCLILTKVDKVYMIAANVLYHNSTAFII